MSATISWDAYDSCRSTRLEFVAGSIVLIRRTIRGGRSRTIGCSPMRSCGLRRPECRRAICRCDSANGVRCSSDSTVGIGAACAGGLARSRFGLLDVRFDGDSRAPAFGGNRRQSGDEALGRSRGGMSTQMPLAMNAQELPLELQITAGQDRAEVPARFVTRRGLGRRVARNRRLRGRSGRRSC